MRQVAVGTLGALALAVAGSLAPAEAAPPLLSHRAHYVMELDRSRAAGEVADATGLMVTEWEDACDGYLTRQRFALRIGDDIGGVVLNDFVTSSWESRDGTRYDFTVVRRVDGEISEEYRGRVAPEGGRPVLRYSVPERAEVALPAETIFPTEYIRRVIAAAEAGENRVEGLVFDGAGEDPLYDIVAFIGRPLGPDAAPPAGLEAAAQAQLAGLASWPIHLSYYLPEAKTPEPDFEMRARLFANGVASDLVLDYGDLALRGALTRLDQIAAPAC